MGLQAMSGGQIPWPPPNEPKATADDSANPTAVQIVEYLQSENQELLHLLRMAVARLQDIEGIEGNPAATVAWLGLEAIAILAQKEIAVAGMLGQIAKSPTRFDLIFQGRPVHTRGPQ